MTDHPAADPASRNATLADMGTARAVRRYTDASVGADLVDAVIWAATRASSPNNTQLWHFIVVRDPERRAAIADALQHFTKWIDQLPTPESASEDRIRAGARGLLTGLADVPVLLFVCVEHTYPERGPDVRYLWSTVGTASQNAIVAARSLGLGATLTMLHVANEERIRALLELPDGVELGSMITLGWPATAHGPMTRKPLAEVVHHDTW
ncbi:MAG TPA: nitroreductase family protein [Agromyces sp.]